MNELLKYPRTPHLTGSRIQPGDEDLRVIDLSLLENRNLIIEEKLDGSNSGISFNEDGMLLLQSRGHFLDGGGRERHFALLKSWTTSHQVKLFDALGTRFVMYGEWLYAKHTCFYDNLEHYFIEFDIFDKARKKFLSTGMRRDFLKGLPIVSAPVVHRGSLRSAKELKKLITKSAFQSPVWKERFVKVCESKRLDAERALRETDSSDLMEGLYFKIEDEEKVIERFKFVRRTFTQAVEESGEHWLNRPVIPNQLREGVDIYAEKL
jgi:hypothetical protein